MTQQLEAWQTALRGHVWPQLKSSTLLALEAELESGGKHLVHRMFCDPPPLHALSERKPVCFCVLGYCGWQENATETGLQVQEWILALGASIGTQNTAVVMCKWDSSEEAMPELHDCCVRESFLSEIKLELELRRDTRQTA